MENVSKNILEIINKKEPVFVDVIKTKNKHTYYDLNLIWTYHLKKKIKNNIQKDLEDYFLKYPLLKNLFDAHYKSKDDLYYCREENNNILINLKLIMNSIILFLLQKD